MLLYITSKCFCVSGPKYMIRTEVYEVLRGVSSAVRAPLPKSSGDLTDVYCMMQWSPVLGQLDQMMLFEDVASMQFPLRKSSVRKSVCSWPLANTLKASTKRDIKPLHAFCPTKPCFSIILSECMLRRQVKLCFVLCNSPLCIPHELLWKVVLEHGDEQSSWFDRV